MTPACFPAPCSWVGNWRWRQGNAVPLFDDGKHSGKPPSVTLVYCHNNNHVLYLRSTDLGKTFAPPVNISQAAHPLGTLYAPNDYFTGPVRSKTPAGLELDDPRHARLRLSHAACPALLRVCSLYGVQTLGPGRRS